MSGELWDLRCGVVRNRVLPCFITGKPPESRHCIIGFVSRREAGQCIVDMFGGLAELDYRDEKHIEVKVGASEEYIPALEALYKMVIDHDRIVTPEIISQVKAIALALAPDAQTIVDTNRDAGPAAPSI